MRSSLRAVTTFGPGLLVAAIGIGVGDLTMTALAGARFGLALGWAVLAGCALKFAVNDAMARFQLTTGSTLVEAWTQHFGRKLALGLSIYLPAWGCLAGAACLSACGLAAHSLFPSLSVASWASLQAVGGLVLVSRFRIFETLSRALVALMCLTLVGIALSLSPSLAGLATEAFLPTGAGARFTLGVLGGVGGSVTLLCHGYWMREHGWQDRSALGLARADLAAGYLVTAALGVSSLVTAAILLPAHTPVVGEEAVLALAEMVRPRLGSSGTLLYRLGFWATALASWLGTLQSVPYLVDDLVAGFRGTARGGLGSPVARLTSLFLVLSPLPLVVWREPVRLITAFAALASLVLPLLTGSLLYLQWRLPETRGGIASRIALVLALILFAILAVFALRPT